MAAKIKVFLCQHCSAALEFKPGPGRKPKFCSDKCRKAAHSHKPDPTTRAPRKYERKRVKADWSFVEDQELMDAMRRLADRRFYGSEWIDSDDAFQEMCLHLAVRPKLQKESPGAICRHMNRVLVSERNRLKRGGSLGEPDDLG